FAGGAIYGEDHLVAALRRTGGRADRRTLERVAADDHGLDARLLKDRLERGAQELVRPALAIPFADPRLDRGIHHVVGRSFAVRTYEAVPDDHVVGARVIMQPLDVGHRSDAARPCA